MIRVRCYTRYSSDEQIDGWSIEAQIQSCRKFVATHTDWMLDEKTYTDEVWSGKTVHRPALQQMLTDARAGQFDVLVCHRLDRFSRTLVDVMLTLDELHKCNVIFASASEPIDFTTPAGRQSLVMFATFAEWYLQNLKAETVRGKHARFEAGYWNGDLRFGYSKAEAGEEIKNGVVKKLYKPVPNADAKYVLMAYEMCAEGHFDQQIADALNEAGARTYRLITNAKSKAGPDTDPALRRLWMKDSIGALFNQEAAQFFMGNTVYVGEAERQKLEVDRQLQVHEKTHEPLISQDLCERALAVRLQRTQPQNAMRANQHRVYLLGKGIAHCNCCGKPLRCINSKVGHQYVYYRCASWLRGEPCEASRLCVREETLAPQLDLYLQALQISTDWRNRMNELLAGTASGAALEKRHGELRARLRRLNQQFENGLISEQDQPEYERSAKALIREINSITVPNAQRMLEKAERLITLVAEWDNADPARRHAILREVFEAVYIDTDNKCIVSVKPFPEFVSMFRLTPLVEDDDHFVLENAPNS